ncbi:putative acyl-[acyl-carrier-protein]--UDP-N-acetylglucosamine O-acyltransferase [Helianthus annuus]|nr:putative acyl-[acyl-carrier-protein]--UDP-N-acetylglucosamine O-acyltransferase [Helianthus annuus]
MGLQNIPLLFGFGFRSVWFQVSQDVPKYTMVAGDRAELRGLNLEGLRRSGFSVSEVSFLQVICVSNMMKKSYIISLII